MQRLSTSLLACMTLMMARPAPAQDTPQQDVAPGARREGVVHVNAMKNPEMHAYRAIAAGLDTFDDLHALAPAVPRLLFSVRARNGGPLTGDAPAARLAGDDFTLALPVDAAGIFAVPRSRAAWEANAELVLNRKRNAVRVWPEIRTPGLADNQRRLGDIRLECRVLIAIAKKEAPFWAVALGNTILMTSDWCGFLKDQERSWNVNMPAEVAAAVLREGDRTLALHVKGRDVEVPLSDPRWGNDALIDVEYATPPAAAAAAP